jgi:hypothetical protein
LFLFELSDGSDRFGLWSLHLFLKRGN